MIVPGSGQIVFTADKMNFSRCHPVTIHPGPCQINDFIGTGPHLQVYTFVETATRSREIVRLGLFIGKDKRIAHADRIKRDCPDFRFRNDLIAWRAVHRVDGQPWLSAPITLADGTTDISPFVILAGGGS